MADRKVKVILEGDNRQLARILRQTNQDFAKTGRSARRSGEEGATGLKRLESVSKTTRLAISGVGALGLAAGLTSIARAGLGLQSSQAVLQNSFRSTGVAGTAAFSGVEKQLEDLSVHGGGSLEAMNAGVANFLNQTRNLGEAVRANQAAVQLSVQTGKSYSETQSLIAGALAGRTRGLQKIIGTIVPVKTAEDSLTRSHGLNLNALKAQAAALGKAGPAWLRQQELLAGITGAQRAQAVATDKQSTAMKVINTILERTKNAHENATTKIQDMRHAFSNLSADLGEMLLPALGKLVSIGDKVAGYFSRHKTLALILVGTLATLTGAIAAVSFATASWSALTTIAGAAMTVATGAAGLFRTAVLVLGLGFEAMGIEASVAWAAATLGISLIIPALLMVITHWKETKPIFEDVWGWIKGHWPLLAGIILAPFIGPVGIIVAIFHKQIWGAIKDVWHWIEGAASDLWGWLTWPFRRGADFVRTVWNGMLKDVRWLWSQIKQGFSELWKWVENNTPVGKLEHLFNIATGKTTPGAASGPGKHIPGHAGTVHAIHGVTSGIGAGAGMGLAVPQAGIISKIGGGIASVVSGLSSGGRPKLPVVRGLSSGGKPEQPRYFDFGGPVGPDVVPAWLRKDEFVLNAGATGRIGQTRLQAWNNGLNDRSVSPDQTINVHPFPVVLKLDSRTLLRQLVRTSVERASRGPSSLSGGSLVTGSGGPTSMYD